MLEIDLSVQWPGDELECKKQSRVVSFFIWLFIMKGCKCLKIHRPEIVLENLESDNSTNCSHTLSYFHMMLLSDKVLSFQC